MRLNLRLARLERRTVGGAECPSCCAPTDGSRPNNVTLVIPPPRIMGDMHEPNDHSRDCCQVCGRRVVLHVPPPRLITADV